MSSMIVCKFGGSSVATSEQFKKVKAIVEGDEKRKHIVVSAPGKRYPDDKKITDLFYLAHETVDAGLDIEPILKLITDRYQDIIQDLNLKMDISDEIKDIANKLAHESADYAASRGEYLNGKVMARYLGFDFVDPFLHIFFDSDGHMDCQKSYQSLSKALSDKKNSVIPGFYGQDPNGQVKTFSRGGSDITGAVVARAVNAIVYENWTDVNGLLMADPNVVKSPKVIHEVSYMELRELSYMGAKVLHDEAIFPVREKGIPVHIRNTNEPGCKGTRIVADVSQRPALIVGIAGRKDFEAFYMNKTLMNREVGFGRKLLAIFENHQVSFEHLPSGIDSISVIVKKENVDHCRELIIEDIHNILKVDQLQNFQELALLAIVGEGMAHHPGTAAHIFTALAESGINIRLIDQGASELNIIIGVNNQDYEKAVNVIYSKFLNN